MATKIKPGRARINAKIMTDTLTMDLTGCEMSKDRAMVIYQMLHGADHGGINAIEARRALASIREAIDGKELFTKEIEHSILKAEFKAFIDQMEAALNKVS